MDANAYFTLLGQLMKDNPPAAADAPELARFRQARHRAGQGLRRQQADAPISPSAFPRSASTASCCSSRSIARVTHHNGWSFTTKTGLYGTDYLMRALVTAIGLGANRPQDAVYPTSTEGRRTATTYDGANKYVMRFPKGQLPPANGFWSLTMYNAQYFFVPNPINRYSISARQNLKSNPDGSTDLYIQKDSPGADKESNWLPAPPGKFVLMLRMYWPTEKRPSIINGTWKIPPVTKV